MGSQRIASELIGEPVKDFPTLDDGPSEPSTEKNGGAAYYPVSGVLGAQSVWTSLDTLVKRLGLVSDANFWDGLTSDLLNYQEFYNEGDYLQMSIKGCDDQASQSHTGDRSAFVPEPGLGVDEYCYCSNSLFYAKQIHKLDCDDFRIIYWYHPDYLGHNEFITDKSGKAYQYFHYFGFF